jgi:hypothetical protein
VKIRFPGDRRWSYLTARGEPTGRKAEAAAGPVADMRGWRGELARTQRGLGLRFKVVSL